MALKHALSELNEREVTDLAVQRLRERISEKSRATLFACKLCGEYRTAKVTDPGSSSLGNYTCADASEKKECKTPATPKTGAPAQNFIPGSLILATLYKDDDSLWPGIIEDPPNGKDLFIKRGLSQDDPAQVFYFVTLIYPEDDDQTWIGGFVKSSDIQPFVPAAPPPNCTDVYVQSLVRADGAMFDSPAERLKKFSFVAHIARKRGIEVEEPSTAAPKRTKRKRTAASRLDSEREESPKKRPRLSSGASQPEWSEPAPQRGNQTFRSLRFERTDCELVIVPYSDSD